MVLIVLIVLWSIVLVPPAWQAHVERRQAHQVDAFRRKASTCRARRASTWDCHAGGTSTMLHSTISTISTIDCTLQQHRYAPAGERNTAAESTGG